MAEGFLTTPGGVPYDTKIDFGVVSDPSRRRVPYEPKIDFEGGPLRIQNRFWCRKGPLCQGGVPYELKIDFGLVRDPPGDFSARGGSLTTPKSILAKYLAKYLDK